MGDILPGSPYFVRTAELHRKHGAQEAGTLLLSEHLLALRVLLPVGLVGVGVFDRHRDSHPNYRDPGVREFLVNIICAIQSLGGEDRLQDGVRPGLLPDGHMQNVLLHQPAMAAARDS